VRITKVEYNDKSQFTYVASLPKEQKEIDYIYTTFQMKPQSGKLVNSDNKRQIVLGHDFADDKIFGKEIQPGSTLRIQGEDFKVSGILKEMSSFQFNSAIFMLEEDMKSLLKLDDEIDLIVVQVESQDKTDSVALDLERKLRKDRNLDEGKEDFSVETPVRALDAINTILNVINAVVAGIAAISLLVGGIGIANTMFTSVLERTKEIGTMKALGAKNKDILLIFLIESGLLGLVGGIVGAGIGLGLAFGISFLANSALGSTILAVQISWPLLIASVSFSFIIGVASGILPAIQGSKLKPVEALRR
jgi:putative ABC transport system permease protein